ncbi:MAG: lysylphosphatidylglycerol synthase transmembrane domain-containing protein [bacterium]
MKRAALTIVGWLISIALISALAARLDWHAIAAGLANARWSLLLAAATLNIAVVALKALRWQWLMNPKKEAGYPSILRATMIGLAGNNVMPARGGDWLKIYLLGKWEQTSKAALASITGLDKLFDALSILMLFGALSFHSSFPEWVQRGTLIISIVTAVSLTICVFLLMHHRRSQRLGTSAAGRISRVASALGSGMEMLSRKRMIAATLLLSLVICLTQIGTLWLCQEAFVQHVDIWIPSVVFVAINLAIVVPSAPSSVGPFEAAAVLAYTWLGLKPEQAFNIAIAYHAVQFIPVTAIGALLYFRELGYGAKRRVRTAEVEQ